MAGQAAAVAIVLTIGGDRTANAFDGLALLVADAVMLAVIVAFARRGARLAASTPCVGIHAFNAAAIFMS